MAIYIHSSVSHSACGNSATDSLTFNDRPNISVAMPNQENVPFYGMHSLSIDSSEARVFTTLTKVTRQLIDKSGLSQEDLKHTALMLGSTSLDIGTIKPSPDPDIWVPKIDRLSEHLQRKLGLSHCHMVFNTACTASINALLYGKGLLENTNIKQVIIIGCEFYNHLTLDGFHSLDLISENKISPFEYQRDGLMLGEGIGALLLSKTPPKRQHYFSVLGGYSACDTSSLTMTAEDGSHINSVLEHTVENSGLHLTDIDLVKVHGTATYNNDVSEYHGLKQFFDPPPPIIALKPYIGHTLGACGALEIALMDELLNTHYLPVPDTQDENLMLPFAPVSGQLNTYKHILINHCGFGGNNAALVLKAEQA
ncbi:beta-ketoacyl synthase N-terminal-like domain-containing protein [Paraglaciecola marina]|uniref:beta-ketoacyl synthase N-terminal-like domain-containing protein n=1 Tax=Paraglaciecola marina TaxID=2500157 RepID=UPI00105E6A1E|nr:beta-ketoacyl synthase N-terminal-like domain-containing protein [Paraglaciecola marina]